MTTKNVAFDPRFRFALLDYRIAKLGITPRLTPAAEVVRLCRALERPKKARKTERPKAA